MKYHSKTLIQIDNQLNKKIKKINLDGKKLSLSELNSIARKNTKIDLTKDKTILNRIQKCHEKMMDQVKRGVPIYGCNTGYGERASHVVNYGSEKEKIKLAKKISTGIVHTDVTVGPPLPKDVIRAAILIRVNMLLPGVSAIKLDVLKKYSQLLNEDLIPVVNQYGGIGASGDLAHNSRVLSTLRQLKGTQVINKQGKIVNGPIALQKANIKKLELDPKAGLGLVNGDNFSNALAALLAIDTIKALLLSHVCGAMIIEVLKGTNRSFHPLIAGVRQHPGQKEVADIYRYLLKGSKLAYQEMNGHKVREKGLKVQDGYSLRCLSQYHGVNVEKLKNILTVITQNMNSVSDNPLWVIPEFANSKEDEWQWVSGGNFIASHMVEVMDSLRKTMTQITKLNDRHLARLVSPHHNNGLAANLSDKKAITRCAFKGIQIQSGMFDVYSALLAMPVSTMFGVHEEGNQDITSHALTSGILGLENLRVTRYSLAQNLIAAAQAIDLRGGADLLSPSTKPIYEFIRSKVEYVAEERPLNNDIEAIYQSIVSDEIMKVVREEVFANYKN